LAGLASAGSRKGGEDGKEPLQRTWRLIFCGRPSVSGQVALGQVYSILSSHWGYSMQDVRSFDFAALLRLPEQSTSASAALLDVYGADVAELFVLSTRPSLQRQGHARALVLDAVAPSLARAGVRRLAVSVDDDDEEARQLWSRYGFTPLAATELRRLSWQLPTFSKEATQGTIYYSLDLTKPLPKPQG